MSNAGGPGEPDELGGTGAAGEPGAPGESAGRGSGRGQSDPETVGSIIDRFKGTEWDSSPPDLPIMPRRSSGPTARPLIVAGLVLLLASGAGAIVVLAPGAFAGPSPTPGTFAPPPTKAPGADVIAAMWKLVGNAEVSYHLVATGTDVVKGGDQRFTQKYTLSLDVAGDDYVGTMAIAGDHTYVWDRFEGTIYIRVAGTSKWLLKTATFSRTFRQTPFMALEDQRALEYVGPIVEGGVTRHRFASTDLYRPSVARMLGLTLFEFPFEAVDPKLDLVVSDTGVPVRATFSCKVAADPEHGIPSFSGSAQFTFSKFGEGPKLTAPPTH